MDCAACGEPFNDGVQCAQCNKHFDYSCAGVVEKTFRRWKADKRAAWTCSACCATPTPLPSPLSLSPEISLETIMLKLNSMALKLEALPTLIADMKEIKADIARLQVNSKSTAKKIQDFDSNLTKMDSRVGALETISGDLVNMRNQQMSRDLWSRLNNVEIKGIPARNSENLFALLDKLGTCINYKLAKHQINYVTRIPSHNNKDKPIVVSFLNRYVKEDFVASARANKSLSSADLGFTGDLNQRIFVNDHLSPDYKKLLTKTKQIANEKGYQYVWVKFSKIHVRKNDTSPIIIVHYDADLNKLK